MSECQRSTRSCTLETMNVALFTAIRAHIESEGLSIEEAPLMCCETLNTRQIKKFFRKTQEITLTSVVLFSKWFIYAVDYPEEKRARFPAVISERLAALSVVDYENTSLYQMIADTGLSISGIVSGGGEVGSIFVGLGPEPAAVALRAAVKEAIGKA